jgi:hypothetical protein
MLTEGAGKRSSLEIADQLAFLGQRTQYQQQLGRFDNKPAYASSSDG